MRIAWATDTHFNIYSHKDVAVKYANAIKASGYDALLITGDISTGVDVCRDVGQLADRLGDPNVFYVLGNHDLWGSSRSRVHEDLRKCNRGVYLPLHSYVQLGKGVYIAGFDGWYDARHGDHAQADFFMNDWRSIEELKQSLIADRAPPIAACKQFADESAKDFFRRCQLVPSDAKEVIIATHIPPWPQNSMHRGRVATAGSLPFYSSRISGNVIETLAKNNPNVKFTVKCGHSHHPALHKPLSNVTAETGAAEYGKTSLAGFFEVNA